MNVLLSLTSHGFGGISLTINTISLRKEGGLLGMVLGSLSTILVGFSIKQNNLNLSSGTVPGLIDNSTHSWKPSLIKALYPHPLGTEILRLPISKTGKSSDNLDWKHSFSGDYQVKKAYKLIHNGVNPAVPNPNGHNHLPLEVWNLVWKV